MSNETGSESNVSPLVKYLDGLVAELRQRLPGALERFDVEDVHKARVTTRRLKAAIDLLDRVLDRSHTKPFAKVGRKLRRRLGPLRDTDVMLSHLDEIKSEHSELAGGAEWLRDRILQDRESARDHIGKRSVRKFCGKLQSWDELRVDLIHSQDAVPSLLAESMHSQLDQFVDQANQLRAKLQGSDSPDPRPQKHDPHQLRIAGKSLRYTLELADAAGHELPADLFKLFKKMQESLGAWHDYVVLAERAMEACLDEELPLHEPRTQRDVLKVIDFAMKHADVELNDFMQLWDEKGQELASRIRDLFPLTSPGALPSQQSEDTLTEG